MISKLNPSRETYTISLLESLVSFWSNGGHRIVEILRKNDDLIAKIELNKIKHSMFLS